MATDQVKTNESSIRQSSLVTEILFYENDLVFSEACSGFLSLLRIARKDGGIISYTKEKGELHISEIPAGVFEDSKLKIFVRENTKDIENLRELKQLAGIGFQRGQVNIQQMIQLVTSDNIVEVEKKLEYFADKADEIAMMNAQNTNEMETQKAIAVKQFEQEFEKFIKEQEFGLKDKELQLKQYEIGLKERDLEMRAQAEMMNAELKLRELDSENAVESAYLQEQGRAARVHEELQALQIKINAMMQSISMEKDLKIAADKKEVDLKKASTKSKEHISDR